MRPSLKTILDILSKTKSPHIEIFFPRNFFSETWNQDSIVRLGEHAYSIVGSHQEIASMVHDADTLALKLSEANSEEDDVQLIQSWASQRIPTAKKMQREALKVMKSNIKFREFLYYPNELVKTFKYSTYLQKKKQTALLK
jgi:hypothetical protein